jgi:PilZ domain-containing protein
MRCTVCNISPEGAAIDVDNPSLVPSRFRLVMARDKSVYECSVIWIRKNRIGLCFATVSEARENVRPLNAAEAP